MANKRYIMIDGIKCWNVESSIDNDQLTVYGLRFRRNQYGNHSITGSIHKYFNDGLHNADDYTLSKLKKTLNLLYDNFLINPSNTILNSVEFGVNIPLDFNPEIVLRSILLYNNKSGYRDKNYIEFPFETYSLKVYSKSSICSSDLFQTGNILRIEIHVSKMRFFEKCNLKLHVVSDLLSKSFFEQLELMLIKAIKDCLIAYLPEQDIQKLSSEQLSCYYKYTNPNYWLKLKGSTKHREFKRFERFIAEYSSVDIKSLLIQLIKEKCAELRDISNANKIDTSWNQNTNNVKNNPIKKRCFFSTSQNKTNLSKWKENTIQIKGVSVPPNRKYYIYCKGCGKKIYNPRKGQVYCSATEVGQAAAQSCRDRVNKPLQRIIKLYINISDLPVLFDPIPFIDSEYKQILERQHVIKKTHSINH